MVAGFWTAELGLGLIRTRQKLIPLNRDQKTVQNSLCRCRVRPASTGATRIRSPEKTVSQCDPHPPMRLALIFCHVPTRAGTQCDPYPRIRLALELTSDATRTAQCDSQSAESLDATRTHRCVPHPNNFLPALILILGNLGAGRTHGCDPQPNISAPIFIPNFY